MATWLTGIWNLTMTTAHPLDNWPSNAHLPVERRGEVEHLEALHQDHARQVQEAYPATVCWSRVFWAHTLAVMEWCSEQGASCTGA
jgi:hypothetical protein